MQSGWSKITHLAVNEVPVTIQHNHNSIFFSQCLQYLYGFIAAHQTRCHGVATMLAIGGRGCSSAPQAAQPYSTQPLPSPLHELEEPRMDGLCGPTPWLSGQREVVKGEKQV